jgi:CheY-like chemotaxis protein
VDVVDNAADAQIRFRDQPPDLLLSDVTLPGAIDGFQLARWARDRHATLPIVLTSGLALSDPPPDLVADPYVRMLAKPFSVSALMAVLAEAQAAAAAPS